MSSPENTRRWPRHPVELAVLVVPRGGDSKLAIPGRGIEISEGGMTLYAGLPLKPGDFMDLEFQTPGRTRISAIVRYRTGYCFGLEFLTPLGQESPKPNAPTPAAPTAKADLKSVLKRKEREIERLRSEISTLKNYGRSPR
jgi:hypothetical protein